MAFKWTEHHLRPSNLADAEAFDREYNHYKGELNGGLDRENLPDGSVGDTHLSAGAFLKHAHRGDIHLQGATVRTNVSGIRSWTHHGTGYDEYCSGWVVNDAQPITTLLYEGMLHLEFNAWAFISSDDTSSTVYKGWAQFAIFVDGSPVIVSGRFWENMNQVHLVGDIPIPTGTHTIAVGWRYAPRTTRTETDAIFHYDGGSLLVLNRYR